MSARDVSCRFSAHMKRIGCKAQDLFEEFDKSATGYLRPAEFRRALTSANFYLTQSEFEALEQLYTENGAISYLRFCEDISPTGRTTLSQLSTLQTVNQNDLGQFGVMLQMKGLTLYDIMKEYDRNHEGRVDSNVFMQAVGYSRIVDSVVKPYLDRRTNLVDYISLQRDISELGRTRGLTSTRISSPLPVCFSEFATAINARVRNLKDEFSEVIRLKRSHISMAQCLSILGTLKLPIPPQQLQEVCLPFTSYEGVDYNALCTAVENEVALKKSSLMRRQEPRVRQSNLGDVLKRLKVQVEGRRIRVSEVFESAMAASRGIMTRSEFYRHLRNFEFELDESDIMALDNEYLLPNGSVDGLRFAHTIDPPAVNITYNVTDSIDKLAGFLYDRKIKLAPFFQVYDMSKLGQITLSQFNAVMTKIGFSFSAFEIRHISRQYGDGQMIRWKEICSDVNEEIPVPRPKERPAAPFCTVSASESLQKTMSDVFASSQRSNTDLLGEMLRLDTCKRGTIVKRRFRDVIESLPLRNTSAEIAELVQFYADPVYDSVDYRRFCDDLTKYSDAPKRITTPTKSRQIVDDEAQLEITTWTVPDMALPALAKLRSSAIRARIDIEELFYAVDIHRTGHVQTKDVKAILAPLAAPSVAVDKVVDAFKDRRMPEKFNYRRMCAAFYNVEPSHDLDDEISITHTPDGISLAPIIANNIRSRLESRGRNIVAYFAGVQTPTITASDFIRILSSLPLVLDDAEKQVLVRHYRSNDMIMWKQFVMDVQQSKPYMLQ